MQRARLLQPHRVLRAVQMSISNHAQARRSAVVVTIEAAAAAAAAMRRAARRLTPGSGGRHGNKGIEAAVGLLKMLDLRSSL